MKETIVEKLNTEYDIFTQESFKNKQGEFDIVVNRNGNLFEKKGFIKTIISLLKDPIDGTSFSSREAFKGYKIYHIRNSKQNEKFSINDLSPPQKFSSCREFEKIPLNHEQKRRDLIENWVEDLMAQETPSQDNFIPLEVSREIKKKQNELLRKNTLMQKASSQLEHIKFERSLFCMAGICIRQRIDRSLSKQRDALNSEINRYMKAYDEYENLIEKNKSMGYYFSIKQEKKDFISKEQLETTTSLNVKFFAECFFSIITLGLWKNPNFI